MKNINKHIRNKGHGWRLKAINEIKVKSKILIILILCLSLVSPNLSQLLFSTSEVSAAVDTPVPNPYPPIEEIAQDDGSVKTIIHLGPKDQGYFQPKTSTVVTVLVDITFYIMDGTVQTSKGINFLFKDVNKATNADGDERDTDLNLGLTVDSKIRGAFFRVPVDNNGDVTYKLSEEDENDKNDKDNANFKNITTNYSGQLGIYYNAAVFPLEDLGGKPIMIGGTGLPIKFQDTAVPPNSILDDASLTMDGVKNNLDSLADIPGYKINLEKSNFSFTTGSTIKKNMAQGASTVSGNLLVILNNKNIGAGSIPEGGILKLVYDKVPTLTINYNHLIGGKASPIKDASILDGDDFNDWIIAKDQIPIENYIFDPAHSEINANGKTTNLLTKYPDLTAANVQDKILTFIAENGNLSSDIQVNLAYYVKATVTPINAEVGVNSKVTPQQVTQKIQLPDVPTLPDDLRNKVVYNNGEGTPVDFDFTKTTGEYVSFNQPLANIDTSKKNAVAQPTTITYTDEVNGIQGSAVANVTVNMKPVFETRFVNNKGIDISEKLSSTVHGSFVEPPEKIVKDGITYTPTLRKTYITDTVDGDLSVPVKFRNATTYPDYQSILAYINNAPLTIAAGTNEYKQTLTYVYDEEIIVKAKDMSANVPWLAPGEEPVLTANTNSLIEEITVGGKKITDYSKVKFFYKGEPVTTVDVSTKGQFDYTVSYDDGDTEREPVTDDATVTVEGVVSWGVMFVDTHGNEVRKRMSLAGFSPKILYVPKLSFGYYPVIPLSYVTRFADGVEKETIHGTGTDIETAVKNMHSGTLTLTNGDNPDDGNVVEYYQMFVYIFRQTAILKGDGITTETVLDFPNHLIAFKTDDKVLKETLGNYQVTGPDGKTYPTLAAAIAANPKYDDSRIFTGYIKDDPTSKVVNDPASLVDTVPQEFTITKNKVELTTNSRTIVVHDPKVKENEIPASLVNTVKVNGTTITDIDENAVKVYEKGGTTPVASIPINERKIFDLEVVYDDGINVSERIPATVTVIPKLTLRTLYVDNAGKVLKTVPDKVNTDMEEPLTFDPYTDADKIDGVEPSMAKSTYSMTADNVNLGSSFVSDLQKTVDFGSGTKPVVTLAPVTNWDEALDAINGLKPDGTLTGMSALNEDRYNEILYTLTYVYPDQVAKIIVNGQEHESLQGFSGYEIAPKTTDEELHKTIDVYTVTVSKRDKDGQNDTIVDPTVYSSLDEAVASNSFFDSDESVDQIFTVTKKEIIRTGINTPTASAMPIVIVGLAGMVFVLKKKYSGRTKPAYKHKK